MGYVQSAHQWASKLSQVGQGYIVGWVTSDHLGIAPVLFLKLGSELMWGIPVVIRENGDIIEKMNMS